MESKIQAVGYQRAISVVAKPKRTDRQHGFTARATVVGLNPDQGAAQYETISIIFILKYNNFATNIGQIKKWRLDISEAFDSMNKIYKFN